MIGDKLDEVVEHVFKCAPFGVANLFLHRGGQPSSLSWATRKSPHNAGFVFIPLPFQKCHVIPGLDPGMTARIIEKWNR